MGSKFVSQASAGYDASPPNDDGTVSEANKVKWSTIKTKLANVLKTFIESINTQLVTTLDTSPRSLSASGSAAATDHWRTVEVVSASVVFTLASASSMASGYIVNVANQSSGDIVVACASGDTIDTVTNTTHTISSKQCREYIVNTAATGYTTKSDRTTAATQAEMEAGTSAVVMVTPSRQHNHPSAAKAWCQVNTGTTIAASYNMTSVTDSGVGDHTFVWNVDFSSAAYVVGGLALTTFGASAATLLVCEEESANRGVGQANVLIARVSDGQLADPGNSWLVWAFGDQ